ncbi:MAG: hypothetical protein P1V51_22345 [Deltaproteobacteria bacterium]|nr:hypothetical protein [Deltaproteobacteria bacterium]
MSDRVHHGQTSDEEVQAKLARLDQKVDEAWDHRLSHVMRSSQGRAFVWGLVLSAGLYEGDFEPDANRTYFLEGRRSVGLDLMRETQRVCPEHHVLMIQERITEAALDEKLRAAITNHVPKSRED